MNLVLQRTGNEHFLHIAGAFVNLANPHIAPDALDGKVGHITVTAVDLQRRAAHPLGHFAGHQFGHRRLLQTRQARILQAGGVPQQLPRRFDLHRHLGQAELHCLMLGNRLAKGSALARITQRRFERRARHADRLRRNADAPTFQAGQRNLVALAFGTEAVGGGYAAALEADLRGVAGRLPGLVFEPFDDVARRAGGHEEGADAFLARGPVGCGHHDGDLSVLAAGDELLDAVEDVVVTLQPCRGAQVGGVRSGLRFGQRERADPLAARHRAQPLVFLRIATPGHQNGAHRAVVHAHDGAGGAVGRGDLLNGQRERQVVEPGAVPFGGHGDAQATQRRQALQRLARKAAFARPVGRMRGDFGLSKIAHRVADHAVIVRKQHDDSEQFNRHCRGLAAADAQRGDALLEPALPQRAQQGHDDARARRADGVAQRHRAAVHVHDLMRQLVFPHRRHGDGGEGFVDFP